MVREWSEIASKWYEMARTWPTFLNSLDYLDPRKWNHLWVQHDNYTWSGWFFTKFHFFRKVLVAIDLVRFAIAPYFQVGQVSWKGSNIWEEANQICQLGKSDLSVHTKSDLQQIFRRRRWNISELDCRGVSRYEFWDGMHLLSVIIIAFLFSQMMSWPSFLLCTSQVFIYQVSFPSLANIQLEIAQYLAVSRLL